MFKEIDIEKIVPNPFQPRTEFDQEKLEEIACSIKEIGIIQPVIVRECNGAYQLIAGERRYRGACKAGLKSVPAIVKQVNDEEMLQMALIENMHRDDLSPIDKANGFKDLMDKFNMTQKRISELFSVSRPAIANTVRLLDLDDEIKMALHNKQITEGHARSLLSIRDCSLRISMLKRIIVDKLSVRESEDLAKKVSKEYQDDSTTREKKYSLMDKSIIDQMREKLGTKVDIIRENGMGRIEIEFYTEEDFERIIETML